jgi:hypothetical protein
VPGVAVVEAACVGPLVLDEVRDAVDQRVHGW